MRSVLRVAIVDFIKLMIKLVTNAIAHVKDVRAINLIAHHAILKSKKKYYK